MNRLQKIVAKIFKIETKVNTINLNDPSKCDNYNGNASKEMLLKVISIYLDRAKAESVISAGVTVTASELKSQPLSMSLAGSLEAQKNRTEIVIVIDDK